MKLSAEQGATRRSIGEYEGKQELFERQTPEVLKTLRGVALVESSESSNRIEELVPNTATPRNRSEHGRQK
jgi:hypothetical protein